MRINFIVTGTSVPQSRLDENSNHAWSLGLPYYEGDRAPGRPLNVIGRGPSVASHIDFLRQDDADNWACGTAWGWCRDNGIPATAIFADPSPIMAEPWNAQGITKAIVSEQCDPSLFAALDDAEVQLMALEQWAVGSTAAVIAAVLGANAGSEVRLFGCEGSFGETTHVNENQKTNLMVVRCNGEVFKTNPQMIIQCEEFVHIWRMSKPGAFVDRSGGLLGAMLNGEWELVEWPNAPENVRRLMQ